MLSFFQYTRTIGQEVGADVTKYWFCFIHLQHTQCFLVHVFLSIPAITFFLGTFLTIVKWLLLILHLHSIQLSGFHVDNNSNYECTDTGTTQI